MKIIITGASKGIGRGIATFLTQDGHDVGLLARSVGLLEEVREALAQAPGRVCIAECDLRNPEQTEAAINALVGELGGVDALINNAGLIVRKDILTIAPDEWRAMMDTNINGVFYATRAVLPHMTAQRSGHIINVSSISGKMPLPGGSGYAASKFAVTGLSQSLFQELRGHGIKVTVVSPGSVATGGRREPGVDESWMVQPEQVGRACRDLLAMDAGTCISELEIRPLSRPPKA